VNNHTVITGTDPLWYKDAVIYELHVKAFCDSTADGMGDFRGLISKLDYLQSLGITALWLLPFYPSPMKDDGYDIADYVNVHPAYGDLRDFREFLREAHRRGLRVITELVLNHTSDQHPWFQRSRRAEPGSVWRQFYQWSDTTDAFKDARIIFKDFEASNWTWDHAAQAYYWHRFYAHQPDLNYDNPAVQRAILRVIDFWFETGVDGLRLDAVPYLFERDGTTCENLPETHQFLKKMRAHVDRKFPGRMLLAEANQWPEDAAAYFGAGDECHMAFHFPIMPRMFMAIQQEDRYPIVDILDPMPAIPESAQWAVFLRNHDELTLEMVTDEERDYMYRVFADDPRAKINLGIRRRLAPLLGNNRRKIELLNILLFSMPGTPVIYYGDEIGMGDNFYLGDRNGVRTPMQWSPDRNGGFSRTNPHQLYLPLIIDSEYSYEAVNVENQEKNLSSLLWWMKRVIAMRKRFKAFSRGTIDFLLPENPKVLAFVRRHESEVVLVVVNLSRFSQVAELDLARYAGWVPQEVFSRNAFPSIRETPYVITLGPHNHFWFQLRQPRAAVQAEERVKEQPELVIDTAAGGLAAPECMAQISGETLLRYLTASRWFRDEGKTVRSAQIIESAPLPDGGGMFSLAVVEVTYIGGDPRIYCVPLFVAADQAAHRIMTEFPGYVIAPARVDGAPGVLYDGSCDERFHRALFTLIAKKKKIRGAAGEFAGFQGEMFKQILGERVLPLASTVTKAKQINTSIFYDSLFILKLYRHLEKGVNPDMEMARRLTEEISFSGVSPFAGGFEYRREGHAPLSVGLLQRYIANQGDGWTYALDAAGGYLDRVRSQKAELILPDLQQSGSAAPAVPPYVRELIGEVFLRMIQVLGKRTAEFHCALASVTEDPDFAPEGFSMLYQRSLFQTMRSLVKRVFGQLEKNIGSLSGELRTDAAALLARRGEILSRLGAILAHKFSGMKVRIHGDYHLGQVLFTGKDFMIMDFEGEPSASLSERRLKRSPLRDVADMMRSFHYASCAALLKDPGVAGGESAYLEQWMAVWCRVVSDTFLRSYLDVVGAAPYLPHKRHEIGILLDIFLVEKAVYELGYELSNRPRWTVIPIRGLQELLKKEYTQN